MNSFLRWMHLSIEIIFLIELSEVYYWMMVKGGYTPLIFWSNRGISQTRPREAPARAPDCPKFSSDELASCSQSFPSTHTFFLFFRGLCWG